VTESSPRTEITQQKTETEHAVRFVREANRELTRGRETKGEYRGGEVRRSKERRVKWWSGRSRREGRGGE
jgi:hypothetical protein